MAPSFTTVAKTGDLFHANSLIPSIKLEGSTFLANGHPILTHVPPNITATPSSTPPRPHDNATSGCFVGFDADEPRSRHVVSIGKLKGIRFTSIFRFKLWWSTHWSGTNGREVEHETQIMMLEKDIDKGRPYVLLLPLLEGSFRASLQPGLDDDDDYVDMCMESGSTRVTESSFRNSLYIHVHNDDPYALVKEAVEVIREHMGLAFRVLEEKTQPGIVDKFGWCTWDAFYLKVHPQGVWEGVKGLVEGGCPPGFVIIDDGWQTFCRDDEETAVTVTGGKGAGGSYLECSVPGEQMLGRLVSFEENSKLKEYRSRCGGGGVGMGVFVRELKEEFGGLEVYVWHAFCGYWGGIRPNVDGMPESRVVAPRLSPGAERTMTDLAVVKIVENGVGLVPPHEAHRLYDGLHSHLHSQGIDGVKIDVTHVRNQPLPLIFSLFYIYLFYSRL